MILKNNPKEV